MSQQASGHNNNTSNNTNNNNHNNNNKNNSNNTNTSNSNNTSSINIFPSSHGGLQGQALSVLLRLTTYLLPIDAQFTYARVTSEPGIS